MTNNSCERLVRLMNSLKPIVDSSRIWCAVIFLIAFAIRLQIVITAPIWLDEAWRITEAGTTTFFSLIDYLLYGLRFETSIFLTERAIESNPNTIRIPYSLISSLAVPAVFIYVNSHVGLKPALLVAIWVAISPWHVTYSSELAAYGIGSTFIMLMVLIGSKSDITAVNKFCLVIVSLFTSAIHLYACVAILIISFLNLLVRTNGARNTYLFILIISLCIFLVKLAYRFSGYESGQALNIGIGLGWSLGYPIQILNSIFLLPIQDRWIPTSFDLKDYFFGFPILAMASLLLLFVAVVKIISRKDEWKFKNVLKNLVSLQVFNSVLIRDSIFLILFIFFIYVQAFFVNASFVRYLILIYPLIISIIVIFIFQSDSIEKLMGTVAICLTILINGACTLLVLQNIKYKSDYTSIYEEFYEICSRERTLFVNSYFIESAISSYYLKNTKCNLFGSKAFEDFFTSKNRSTLEKVDSIETSYSLPRELKEFLSKYDGFERLVVIQNRRPMQAKILIEEIESSGWYKASYRVAGEFEFKSFTKVQSGLER